ncbi:hypothetical protein HYH03_015148 [Edaphochlamys debaryana]|uniref:Uncharacterized protein n=1 Tax=Edaphochlamys debaryana TaxID=47281 RepID=A0A835XQ20_9CHLO|nr:hypothetical protein HYH03_015148 [Edaphochlamys debaryana]|eukprot:KAG2486186.1 hypothetical protein HYH03_015148 [Edaphochlamys debaryana]
MALQVNLTLSKTYFLPGEVVQVSVQICNGAYTDASAVDDGGAQGAPQVIHVKELSFQACGTERTDPSFIHRLHRPEVPVDVADSRKQVRSIFSTEPAVLVSDQALAPHAVQHFQLRFRLPSALPPSFRGSAVRFLYLIQVKAVYEVHRGGSEAVMYETTASTSLVVWPGSAAGGPGGAGAAPAAPDRRTPSMDASSPGAAAFGAAAAAAAASALQREVSRSSTAGDPSRRLSSAGGAPPQSPSAAAAPPTPSGGSFAPGMGGPGPSGHSAGGVGPSGGGGGGGGAGAGADDGEVGLVDYVLGRNNCRIRWQELRADAAGGGAGSEGGGLSGPLPSASSFGSATAAPQPAARGVIPFGVNRPFSPPFGAAAGLTMGMLPYSDSDAEELAEQEDAAEAERAEAEGAAGRRPGAGPPGSTAASTAVQRQMSSGAGAAAGAGAGVGPYGRQPSRRGGLFGKVYALNVGEAPLLRLLLQAPLEVPLQPGATFGGVLDFRPPASPGSGPVVRPPSGTGVCCHEVVVLLESEECVAPECRPGPQPKGPGAGSPYVIRRLHAEAHELAADMALTSFTFSLPATATPSFRTPMVSLRWVLRFELTVGPRIAFAALDKRARSPRPALEQLVWSLPLVVRPPVAAPRGQG